jgi:hypothetical protein
MLVYKHIFTCWGVRGSIRLLLDLELSVLSTTPMSPIVIHFSDSINFEDFPIPRELRSTRMRPKLDNINHGQNTVAKSVLDFINFEDFPIPRELRSTRMRPKLDNINHGRITVATEYLRTKHFLEIELRLIYGRNISSKSNLKNDFP